MSYTSRIRDIQATIGPAVLLPIRNGEKRPVGTGWQTTTMVDMDRPEYVETLNNAPTIGVLLGKPSGGLVSIDCDSDQFADELVALNPWLKETLRTKGKRGCNFWLRIRGDYPELTKLTHRTQVVDGKAAPVGEWRADGGQTVITGIHPDGGKYRILKKAKPREITFGEIIWPPEWNLPWSPESELVEQHGAPFSIGKGGRININPVFFAAKFAKERTTMWVPDEAQFYQYDGKTGLWTAVSRETIKLQIAQDLKRFADQARVPDLLNRRTNFLLSDLTELVKGLTERVDAFGIHEKLIHLRNGVLDLSTEPPRLLPFAPEHFSRNQTPVDLVEDADCPRFKHELLVPALAMEDISLLQRWCGSVLLKHNAAQKILLLTGTAGGGKSTLVDILETIIGKTNSVELRTWMLSERFEISRFVGKTLLSGKDVSGDFLMQAGASALKKLVGHDLLGAERKGSNQYVQLKGDFACVCTCNSRLRVRLDGDVDAWRRRLLLVEYNRPKPQQPIRDFSRMLVDQEGAGILLWMVQGAVLHLAELAEHGDFTQTDEQRRRVDSLLDESDGVRQFVRECLEASEGDDVTTDELVAAHFDFCNERSWHAPSRRDVENQLPDIMLEIHRVNKRHDIKRGDRKLRGYVGVCLLSQS